jgi:tetratricopeptide (TPR) repeat protein
MRTLHPTALLITNSLPSRQKKGAAEKRRMTPNWRNWRNWRFGLRLDLAGILAILAALPAAADVIHLRNGGQVEGKVTDLGDAVEIDTGRGKYKIAKVDVERIEAKPWTPPAAEPAPRPAEPAPAAPGPGRAEAPPARPRLGDPYTHPFVGFTFRPPLDWASGEAQTGAAASFYGPAEKFYVPRLDVLHVRLGGTDTLAEFLKTWKASHERTFPGWSVVSEELTGIRGALGTRLVTRLGGETAPLQNLSVILQQGARVFVLNFTTGRGYFDRYAPVVERSFQTFRFLPEAPLDAAQRRAFQDRYNAAAGHMKAGRTEEAIAGFRACAELLPAFADLHRALGSLQAEAGRDAEAVAAYRKAIALDPDHADAHYNLGTLLLRQVKTEEAIALLKKAVALDPEHERAWINLGTALSVKGALPEARAALERGCTLAPESAAAHLALAHVYEKLNETARAVREYRDVLQLAPDHPEAKSALERLKGR